MISSLTIIEDIHARTDKSRLNWALSGLRVVPAGDGETRAAWKPQAEAGCTGTQVRDRCAVVEAALQQHRSVIMLTSDIDDMIKLCGDRVRLVAV